MAWVLVGPKNPAIFFRNLGCRYNTMQSGGVLSLGKKVVIEGRGFQDPLQRLRAHHFFTKGFFGTAPRLHFLGSTAKVFYKILVKKTFY